ncbi:hypothetical protein [Actinoplanes friuliensis]|uniref:hypothetical protein n=1 Tax=Actinoplanes friuliensis TaxID=196914 RepID=UPI00041CB512|nr:hypothetical protein [Actinoplanes friuliensis]
MRLSPKPIFFGLVALGLPFAVTVGWTLGTPAPAPPAVSAPGGAGGIGIAPTKAAKPATGTVVDWSPPATRPVAVESSLPPSAVPVTVLPSAVTPSAVVSGSPSPTFTLLPPVPTPTAVVTTPPSPSPTGPSTSAEPSTSGLSAARLVRGS